MTYVYCICVIFASFNVSNLITAVIQSACGQADKLAGRRRSDGYAAAVGNGFVTIRIGGGHAGYVQVRIQRQLCAAGYGGAGDVAVAFHVDGIAQPVVVATGSTAEIDAFGYVGRIIGNVLVRSMQLTTIYRISAGHRDIARSQACNLTSCTICNNITNCSFAESYIIFSGNFIIG